MDQRQTFSNVQQLLAVVAQIFEQQQTASLLIDKEGLTRIEGNITSIDHNDCINETVITIDDSTPVLLKEIIGVNGLFRPDYSEC